MEKKNRGVIICDIDNCFTDSREWIKLAEGLGADDREGWDNYMKSAHLAKPNQNFIEFICRLVKLTPIYFLTGREDRLTLREDTINHITNFSNGELKLGENCFLKMRKECDYRRSDVVKKEMLDEVIAEGYTPMSAIDDEAINCKMFKENGCGALLYNIEEDTLDGYSTEES